jgi:hypothetical protein
MKNKRILYIAVVLIMTLLFAPASVDAKEFNAENKTYKVEEKWYQEDNIFLASNINKNAQILADCNSSILGSTSDPDSVAWLLQQILNYIRALGPAIVVVLSGVEFAKVIVTGDDDGMKKAQKKLITRLILVALLFFVPTITLAILDIFGMSSNDPTCGLE